VKLFKLLILSYLIIILKWPEQQEKEEKEEKENNQDKNPYQDLAELDFNSQ